MTIGSLIAGTLVSQILFAVLKIFFIGSLNIDNNLIWAAFFMALMIVTIAIVRRLGILNYVESFFLAAVWTIAALIVDYVVTVNFLTLDMYQTWTYWLTHIIIILTIIIFHKSIHVEVRKANR